MPYANNYYDDEEGGATLRWPWGTEEAFSDVMGRTSPGAEDYSYPVPSPKLSYPVTTGGTQPSQGGYVSESAYNIKSPRYNPNLVGNKPFFIPSGAAAGGGRVPGQAWGAGGPTGGYMTAPQMGPMPEFEMPAWDEKKIESKAQRAAGPGLRELRKGIREAQGRYYENPNVRRMTLRDAMAGYGMGLEKVIGGARREAVGEYAAEYGPQVSKAQMEYQAQTQSMMAQYQAAWKEYLTRMQTA